MWGAQTRGPDTGSALGRAGLETGTGTLPPGPTRVCLEAPSTLVNVPTLPLPAVCIDAIK